ncbi:uncharacterized protein [Cicer arietinum]|uniref:Uncharacterized protein LOC101501312 n=1 Tax=Cicer arietinum TaxID=3827 RepID=A0A1S2YNJ1_CICAR|nr:uncharacterized protein LOC101501312 [Cicer arietinum]
MVQRKGCSKLGIQVDHVRSDKSVANLKLAYSQRQNGTSIGNDGMKKMKKSSSIKLSGSETLQSLPPRKSLSQSTKLLPFHIPTIAATPQKHNKPLFRSLPNYIKPTCSSDAKKELLPVSLQNKQGGSDGKNLPQKVSLKNSKSSYVSNKKTAKSMSRLSSVNLVKTLTKTLSFKPSTTCPRKSTMAVLCADINAPDRATCSSILKDSKYPAYLVHNLRGSESKEALIIKVCPYTYCSLNGNHHDPLPQFNHIMSTRRCLLKTQKSKKMEAPQKLKVPCETRKDFDIEQIVFDGIPACDEADRRNPIIIPFIQKIGMDFVIEVCDKERRKAYEMGRSDTVKHLEDQEGIKFVVEGNDNTTEEEDLTLCVPCDLTKFEINPKVEFKNYFDTSEIEEDTNESFHQKPCAEDAEKNHSPRWFHEEICAGSYCHEVGYDEEHMETTELDYYDSQGDMEWDKEQICLVKFGHLKNTGDNDREIEKCMDNEASCTSMVLDEDTIDNNEGHKICEIWKFEESCEDNNTKLENDGKDIGQRNQIPSSDVPEESIIIVQDKELLEEDQVTDTKFQTISCICGEKWNTSNNWQWPAKNKRPMQDVEEMRKINPRKPNFLPLAADSEPERVELKHQIMDDRKIAEEWMLDFSLRQAVTKLAPAGKKKVALLVEAFETVMSTSQCETYKNNSSFSHAKPIQAWS